ncbi:pentatricopeptide repeat-containing protein [Tanacetum coccineum]
MYGCGFVAKPELVAGVVSVCGRFGCEKVGKMIHGVCVVDERFEKSDRNEVSWTTMIMGYVEICDYVMALDCFRRMQVEGITANRVSS